MICRRISGAGLTVSWGILLQAESRLLSRILPDLFGYHALQIGQVVEHNLLASSRIRHRCVADIQLPSITGLYPLRAEPDQLPFANNSLDLVFIHHGLDGATSPACLAARGNARPDS
jgi:hypothetical protein